MKRLALAAALLLASAPADAATRADVRLLESRIEAIGARVLWSDNHSACFRKGLLGKYVPFQRTVYICQRRIGNDPREILSTLQHEGWHAVQHICNGGEPVLSNYKVQNMLTSSQRTTVDRQYPSNQKRTEAEARALESIPLHAFLRGVSHYCRT